MSISNTAIRIILQFNKGVKKEDHKGKLDRYAIRFQKKAIIFFRVPLFFMRRDEKTLERIYEKDKTCAAFIISIALDRYVDVFNELDSAPWRRRDLDHDLRMYLEDCSSDIPLRYDIILQFDISQEKQDNTKEERLKAGLKTYFAFVRSSLQKKIRNEYERSVIYVLGAFGLLFLSYSLLTTTSNPLFTTVVDGVSIVGWVF